MQGEFRFKERNIAFQQDHPSTLPMESLGSSSMLADGSSDPLRAITLPSGGGGDGDNMSSSVVATPRTVVSQSSDILGGHDDHHGSGGGGGGGGGGGIGTSTAASLSPHSIGSEMNKANSLDQGSSPPSDGIAVTTEPPPPPPSTSAPLLSDGIASSGGGGGGSSVPTGTVTLEDIRLLDRVKWLLGRYKEALPVDYLYHQQHLVFNNVPPAVLHTTRILSGQSNDYSGGGSGSGGGSIKQVEEVGVMVEEEEEMYDRPVRRASLFKPSSGTIQLALRSSSSAPNSQPQLIPDAVVAGVPQSPTRRLSILRRTPSRGASRTSSASSSSGNNNNVFFANAVAQAAAAVNHQVIPPHHLKVNTNNTQQQSTIPSQMLLNSSDDFYTEEQLEDLVIVWAKMLVTFFDFLETGDITNLPDEDRRMWAQHLLDKVRQQQQQQDSSNSNNNSNNNNMTNPATNDDSSGSVPVAVTSSKPLQDILSTVDRQMSGMATWQEALLTLRAMFPGAGNFSGLGRPLTPEKDVLFAQRIIQMQEDIRRIETQSTVRHQRRFIREQLMEELQSAEQNRREQEEEEDRQLKVYAGNLSRLTQLEEQKEESERHLLSKEYALQQALPQLTAGGDEDEDDGDSDEEEEGQEEAGGGTEPGEEEGSTISAAED
eukprot:scaffold1881_cov181-Ochromonas_danica.AAC.13